MKLSKTTYIHSNYTLLLINHIVLDIDLHFNLKSTRPCNGRVKNNIIFNFFFKLYNL